MLQQNLCANCNGEKHPAAKYCSNVCQKQFESIAKYELWKTTGARLGTCCLKTNMIREFGHCCMICKLKEWLGKPISLEIDHIDGNAYNNIPSNLRLICPNCHSQTDTYKALNKGQGRKLGKPKAGQWLLV